MTTYNRIAANIRTAETAAGDYFKTYFGHSGLVGKERMFLTECECGKSLAIEYYSKDDPAMDDTFTVLICESCHESASNIEKL
jgi:hypothetical protein